MKRIGIDARLINQTGVGVYIRNLLHYLDTSDKDISYYVYLLPEDYGLQVGGATEETRSERQNLPAIICRSAPYRWHSVDEQTGFLRMLRHDNLDLMHFTYFSFPYFYTRPFVITIHDLTPLLLKTGRATTLPSPLFRIKHTGYKHLLTRGIRQSRAVIVPSESVKSEIIRLFGKEYKDKIHVTYEGIDTHLQRMKADDSILKRMSKPYLLYVGNSYPHKNIEILLQAFVSLDTRMKLVLVGPKDFFSAKITQCINEYGLSERVTQLFNISQEQKIALYKNAHALVQPSLSEGFGLPLIEAQYFGCPVVASSIPVFDEILPKGTPRFDPLNVASIRSALEQAAKKRPTASKLDNNRFSFEKMTQETQKIYGKVILGSVATPGSR